jgi:hypothetical protein
MQANGTFKNQIIVILISVGTLLTFIIPLLIPFFPLQYLKEYGDIGDAIGGIANPIAQIVGFLLLYLALRAQLKANSIVQMRIEEDNRKETKQRELRQVHELYTFLENNIHSFSYERKLEKDGSKQTFKGRKAIRCFIDDIEDMNIDLHNAEQLLQEDGVREILSILKLSDRLFQKINQAQIDNEDKAFYFDIVKHELTFSIFPYTDLDDSANLKMSYCEDCDEFHGNYPPLIFDKLQELKKHFWSH